MAETESLQELASTHHEMNLLIESLYAMSGIDHLEIGRRREKFVIGDIPVKDLVSTLRGARDRIYDGVDKTTPLSALLYADVCAQMAGILELSTSPRLFAMRGAFFTGMDEIKSDPQLAQILGKHPGLLDRSERVARIQFWTDDSLSTNQRVSIIEKLFPWKVDVRTHMRLISSPLNNSRRYFIYNQSREFDWRTVDEKTAPPIREQAVPNHEQYNIRNLDLAFALALDQKVAELLGTRNIQLKPDQDSYSLSPDDERRINNALANQKLPSANRTAIELSLERLYQISSKAFVFDSKRNPGVLLNLPLILTEKTRKQIVKSGQLTTAFRKTAREFHPDTENGNEELFKEINFANDVLSNEEKFRDWKNGKLRFQFKQ